MKKLLLTFAVSGSLVLGACGATEEENAEASDNSEAVSQLQEENETLQSKIDDLEGEIKEHEDSGEPEQLQDNSEEITKLKEENESLQNDVSDLEEQLAEKDEALKSVKNDIEEKENEIAELKQSEEESDKDEEDLVEEEIIEESSEDIPREWESALASAYNYSDLMHMSKQGIYDQLTSEYGEGFPAEAAQYAIDNVDIDWNLNALESARNYQELMNMSHASIYDQLVSEYGEQFTAEEAQYAIDNLEK